MEMAAIVLTFVVHVIGAGVLIWALLDGDESRPSWRGWWPGERRPDAPDAPPDPSGGGIDAPALPDAAPSPVRLREPGRLADAKPRPARRPAHPAEPVREPAREREPA
jgi:hypothetical protein